MEHSNLNNRNNGDPEISRELRDKKVNSISFDITLLTAFLSFTSTIIPQVISVIVKFIVGIELFGVETFDKKYPDNVTGYSYYYFNGEEEIKVSYISLFFMTAIIGCALSVLLQIAFTSRRTDLQTPLINKQLFYRFLPVFILLLILLLSPNNLLIIFLVW